DRVRGRAAHAPRGHRHRPPPVPRAPQGVRRSHRGAHPPVRSDARVEPSAEVVRRKGAALPAPVPESRGMSRELPTFTWPHKIHEIRAKLRRYYARDQISGTPPALAVA
ncbi:uncharacterized protein ACA1_179820, partial [Acanthamoeba castellanii str. Neff]